MSVQPAFFSVVVNSFSRSGTLASYLEALAALEDPRDRSEVIVVDDGGAVAPNVLVGPFRYGLEIALLRPDNTGAAAARNAGAARTRAGFFGETLHRRLGRRP